MKIFLSSRSGSVDRYLLRRLRAEGHDTVGIGRARQGLCYGHVVSIDQRLDGLASTKPEPRVVDLAGCAA